MNTELQVSDAPLQLSQGAISDNDTQPEHTPSIVPWTAEDLDFGDEIPAVKDYRPTDDDDDTGGLSAAAMTSAFSKNRPSSSSSAPTRVSSNGKKRIEDVKKAVAASPAAKARNTSRSKHVSSLVRKPGHDDKQHMARLKHAFSSNQNGRKKEWCAEKKINRKDVDLKDKDSALTKRFFTYWDAYVSNNPHLSEMKAEIAKLMAEKRPRSRSRSKKNNKDNKTNKYKLAVSPSKSAKMDGGDKEDDDPAGDNIDGLRAEIESFAETEEKSPVLVMMKIPARDESVVPTSSKSRSRSTPRRQEITVASAPQPARAQPAPNRAATPPTQAIDCDTEDEAPVQQQQPPPSPSFSPVLGGGDDEPSHASLPPLEAPTQPPVESVAANPQPLQPAIATVAIAPAGPVEASKSVGKREDDKKAPVSVVVPDTKSDAEMAKHLNALEQRMNTRSSKSKDDASHSDTQHLEVTVTPGNPAGGKTKKPKKGSVLSTYMQIRNFNGGKVSRKMADHANAVIEAAKQRKDTDLSNLIVSTIPHSMNDSSLVNVAKLVLIENETIGRMSDELAAVQRKVKELSDLKETAEKNPVTLDTIKTQIETTLLGPRLEAALRSVMRDEVSKLVPAKKRKEREDVDDDDTPIPAPKRQRVNAVAVADQPFDHDRCIACQNALSIDNSIPVLWPGTGHRDCMCSTCRHLGKTIDIDNKKYSEYAVINCVSYSCKNEIHVRYSRSHTTATAHRCDTCVSSMPIITGKYGPPVGHRRDCTCGVPSKTSNHWKCARCNCYFKEGPADLGAVCTECRAYVMTHGYEPERDEYLELTTCISPQKCSEVTLVAKGYVGWFCERHIANTCGATSYEKLKTWMSNFRNAHVDDSCKS